MESIINICKAKQEEVAALRRELHKVPEIIRNEKEKYGTKVHIVKYESTFYHGVGNGKGIAI